jgi:hypothetical protein
MKTYYFNTGVKPWNSSPLKDGEIWSSHNEKLIPFTVDKEIPENKTFQYGANNPNLATNDNVIVAKVLSGGLCSEYAYFF